MSDKPPQDRPSAKAAMDPETLLLTLDQVQQTIEVLSGVVTRLQRYVQSHMPRQAQDELPFPETSTTDKRDLH